MSTRTLPCAVRLRQAAGRGAQSLSDAARERVCAYLEGQRAQDGGFRGRDGASDLYYSLFGLDSLAALAGPGDWRDAASYLGRFGDGEGLDLIDLCCLARCLALTPGGRRRAVQAVLRLDDFVAPAGGYRPIRALAAGSIAASFAAQLAHEELGLPIPAWAGIDACLTARQCTDGAWSDVPGLESGTTTVTAAATLMRAARGEPADDAASWLVARYVPTGGFVASPEAPVPDLLSTAAALSALAALDVSLRPFAADTIAFIDSLWSDDGGFRGYAADQLSDCEFTYYALVALGILGEDAS